MAPIVSDSYKEKKRKEILDSAFVCFAQKGFLIATVDDIVQHSGISKGAIYNYFKSKDEIFLELMKASTEATYEKLTGELGTCTNSIDKIIHLFDMYLSPKDREDIGNIVVHDEFKLHASRHPELLEKLNQRRHEYFIQLFSQIIKEGQHSGEIKKDLKPEIYANVFWSMIDGAMIQTIYPDFPCNDVINKMREMFLRKIKA
ncbi:TetR/AcrR family transcriptional regulator [Neobacillus sp. GCM10023253]|uniref:TetR/AcrR family transcriptional regulator n=1 Tax=Neobacillus sp. GCM10023253 TaxID=3252644 RepID=UPI00361FCC40